MVQRLAVLGLSLLSLLLCACTFGQMDSNIGVKAVALPTIIVGYCAGFGWGDVAVYDGSCPYADDLKAHELGHAEDRKLGISAALHLDIEETANCLATLRQGHPVDLGERGEVAGQDASCFRKHLAAVAAIIRKIGVRP